MSVFGELSKNVKSRALKHAYLSAVRVKGDIEVACIVAAFIFLGDNSLLVNGIARNIYVNISVRSELARNTVMYFINVVTDIVYVNLNLRCLCEIDNNRNIIGGGKAGHCAVLVGCNVLVLVFLCTGNNKVEVAAVVFDSLYISDNILTSLAD